MPELRSLRFQDPTEQADPTMYGGYRFEQQRGIRSLNYQHNLLFTMKVEESHPQSS